MNCGIPPIIMTDLVIQEGKYDAFTNTKHRSYFISKNVNVVTENESIIYNFKETKTRTT